MKFEELVRLHIDVQFGQAGRKKRNKKKLEEQIFVITLADSDGNEYTFNTHKHDERTVLENCIQRINTINPDIIEGYDLFGSILPALNRACERSQISFAIGRDGSDMRTPAGYSGANAGEAEWLSFDVFGRHLVDLLTLAENEIDVKRFEHSFTLNSLAKHFGIPIGKEKQIPNQQISEEWSHRPNNIKDKSIRNVRIARDLYNQLSPPLFYLAQICPFNYRMLTQLSATSRIESLILREYVRQKFSVSRANENSRSMIIPSEVFYTGVFSDVLYVELEGIHSSTILDKNIKPKTDELNVFLPLLKNLSALKQNVSDLMTKETQQFQESEQKLKAIKRLIDSFHLYLGSSRGLFNDPEQAEFVMTASREILKEIFHQAELFNATVIQSDNNGMFILPPNNVVGEENQKNFVERLSSTLPEGTTLILLHQYKKMLSYRKNNYALLDQNNNVFIKGNNLISRGMEHFLKIFIQRLVECILTNDIKRMHHTYATAHTQVMQHKWTPLDFCRTDIVRTDTETYKKEIQSGQINVSPAMEAAVRSSLFLKANSKVSYYFTGSEAGIVLARSSRLIDEWNPNQPDENTAFYLARLNEAVGKFREFFEPSAFEQIFTLDEIFSFSDEGIQILTRKIAQDSQETKPQSEEYGIWLADEE